MNEKARAQACAFMDSRVCEMFACRMSIYVLRSRKFLANVAPTSFAYARNAHCEFRYKTINFALINNCPFHKCLHSFAFRFGVQRSSFTLFADSFSLCLCSIFHSRMFANNVYHFRPEYIHTSIDIHGALAGRVCRSQGPGECNVQQFPRIRHRTALHNGYEVPLKRRPETHKTVFHKYNTIFFSAGPELNTHTGTIVFIGVKFVNKFAAVALACVIFSIIAVYVGIFDNFNGNDKLWYVTPPVILEYGKKNLSMLELVIHTVGHSVHTGCAFWANDC